jgi:hypothetical protein
MPTVLGRLASALDIPLAELVGQRPRLDGRRDGASILAVRDALLSPALLPGIEPSDDAEPTPLPDLRDAVTQAGLLLIEALSREWGSGPRDSGGKVVYCVLGAG